MKDRMNIFVYLSIYTAGKFATLLGPSANVSLTFSPQAKFVSKIIAVFVGVFRYLINLNNIDSEARVVEEPHKHITGGQRRPYRRGNPEGKPRAGFPYKKDVEADFEKNPQEIPRSSLVYVV